MRLSAAQIRNMPVEGQMRAILCSAIDQEEKLPAGIFFCPTPRMPSTGRLFEKVEISRTGLDSLMLLRQDISYQLIHTVRDDEGVSDSKFRGRN